MTGWKTKLGGIGLILTGLSMIIAAVSGDHFDVTKIQEGAMTAMSGFAVLGIGHKIEKSGT